MRKYHVSASCPLASNEIPHPLVPHVAKGAGALGNGLLLEAGPAGRSVVVLRVALHVVDFVEQRAVGL